MVGIDIDELCVEFGTLRPHERIDVLSGLLQKCSGPELRFIGSVVVDLCKKDYIFLREQENKANKPEELESLKQNPTGIKSIQHAMAMNLALLHTDNTHCASIVFDILENNMKQAFTITPSTEKESVDIILLVLAMAMRHPAFTFFQKTELYNYYMCVKQQLDSLLCKVDGETHQETTPESRCNQEAVSDHICNLDVLKTDKSHRHERKREHRIQVLWQDSRKTEVLKTYQDFKEFHSKLVKQFPEEADLPKQERKLPFFSGTPGIANTLKEEEQTVAQYTKHLLQMPKKILYSELVVKFFKGGSAFKTPTAKPATPVNAITVSKGADHVIEFPPGVNTHIPNPVIDSQPQEILEPYIDSGAVPQRFPPMSPVSPIHSPQLTNSRSTSPGEQDVTNLGKEANVNQNCIDKVLPIKHWSMEENGSSLSLTPEQAAKIRADLASNRDKQLNNGLIDHFVVVTSAGHQIPHMWSQPMMQQQQPPFPAAVPTLPVQPMVPHHPYVLPVSQASTSTRDSSPSNSDYSSPLPSPLLKKKTVTAKETDSSSEENDKEKSKKNVSPHMRKVHKTMSGEGYCHDGYDVGGLATLTAGGYQSDPSSSSSGYFPVINVAPCPQKAQPAHTSKTIPPNNIISMPVESHGYGKRGQITCTSIPLGMAPPIPRSDPSTLTSSSLVTSVTAPLDNMGKTRALPIQYFIRAPRICSVTNSTTVTMSASNNITSPASVNGLKPQMTHSQSESALSSQQSQEPTLSLTLGQPQTTPTSTPNMQLPSSSSTHTACSNCGCTGHIGTGTTLSHPYQQIIPSHLFPGQQLVPWPTTVPMTGSSNGIISPHFIPYYHFQNLNGMPHPDLLLNNYHNNFVHTPQGPPLVGPSGNVPRPIIHQGLQRVNSIKEGKEKPRIVSCYNCGSHDHLGHDCSEGSMESILGHYHLNYEPKEG